jgi:hypothetical protein
MNDEDQIKAISALLQHVSVVCSEIRRNSGYLARQEIRQLTMNLNPRRLEQYGFKVYSQNDEDGILAEIFRRIDLSKGVFCEIGVEDGLECNTLFLLHQGWRGAWLEGNQNQKQVIEGKFGEILKNRRLSLGIGYITPTNINVALKKALDPINVDPTKIEFLSIDVDGMDIYLLEALEYSPKVICIEYNAKFPPPVFKKPVFDENYAWKGTDYMGSSLTAINEVAVAKGYSLVATNINGTNAFFVRRDLIGDKFDNDLTPENLYNPPRYWLFFDHFAAGIGHRADFGRYTDME